MGDLVNKRELAKVMGVSEPTVESWLDDGLPVVSKGSNGVAYQFDVEAVKAWKVAREDAARSEVERRQQSLFGDGERLAPAGNARDVREMLEAERVAMALSAQRREHIPRQEVEDDYKAVFGLFRQHVLALDSALTRSAGLTQPQQQEHRRLIRVMMGSLSGAIRDANLRPPPSELFSDVA